MAAAIRAFRAPGVRIGGVAILAVLVRAFPDAETAIAATMGDGGAEDDGWQVTSAPAFGDGSAALARADEDVEYAALGVRVGRFVPTWIAASFLGDPWPTLIDTADRWFAEEHEPDGDAPEGLFALLPAIQDVAPGLDFDSEAARGR